MDNYKPSVVYAKWIAKIGATKGTKAVDPTYKAQRELVYNHLLKKLDEVNFPIIIKCEQLDGLDLGNVNKAHSLFSSVIDELNASDPYGIQYRCDIDDWDIMIYFEE